MNTKLSSSRFVNHSNLDESISSTRQVYCLALVFFYFNAAAMKFEKLLMNWVMTKQCTTHIARHLINL